MKMPAFLLIFLFCTSLVSTSTNESMCLDGLDPAADQIVLFKERHTGPVGVLTTSNGARVSYADARNSLNTVLMNSEYFMEKLAHLNRERLPERIVHAKGGGAFGYFEVTQDISNICKAAMFNKIGKKTPIAVRFSPTVPEKGGNDLLRDGRGFAVKFYTEDGNFDIVGLHFPIFGPKDPLKFADFTHAGKRNPATHLIDFQTLWDFLVLNPEIFHFLLYQNGDGGIPASYVNMPGFSIQTYQVENKQGDTHFVRFHFVPDAGIKNLTQEEANKIAGEDLDYLNRLLYRDIGNGKFPSWTVSVQVLTMDDVIESDYDVFDVTRILCKKKFPLKEVGKIILNENPKNFFAEIEQLGFCPGHLVDGILGDPTTMFEARRFFYKDALNYRLGVNFNKISVNCPYRTNTLTYNRDGAAPVKDNEKDIPNYYPNSFYGPIPAISTNKNKLIKIIEKVEPNNFDQACELYNGLTNDERTRLVATTVFTLKLAIPATQKKAIAIFNTINPDLGRRVAQELKKVNQA